MAQPFHTRELFIEHTEVKLTYLEIAKILRTTRIEAMRRVREDLRNDWIASPQKGHYHLTPKGRRDLPINVFFSILQGGMRSQYGN